MKLSRPYTLEEIASLLNLPFSGNPRTVITGINEIHKVEPGDVTFVDHEKYYARALNSPAAAIIIDRPVEQADKCLIFADDPFTAYNKLAKHFRPFEPADRMISQTAVIGDETIIQPGVFIGNHVQIGKRCIIHPHVTIYDHAIIGDDVVIHANTVIGSQAFYVKRRDGKPLKYEMMHTIGRVIIEDHVEIGAGCTIDSGVSGDTIIGRGTKMDNQIHIGHGTVIGKNCLFAGQVGIGGKVIIEDNVILWGQVGVSKDLRIGANAVVLAQSGVARSLEGNKVYFGSPVEEARKKWKEIALMKNLPEIWNHIKKLNP